jgi:hypothetical protein
MDAGTAETLWHVTVLSNFARGYDKYARVYSKAGIAESTFPDRFFLLRRRSWRSAFAKQAGSCQSWRCLATASLRCGRTF